MNRLLLVVALLLVPALAKAEQVASQTEVDQVRKVRERFSVIDENQKRGFITPEGAQAIRRAYLFDASTFGHRTFKDEADIDAFLMERQDFLTKAANFMTFNRIILAVAAILLVISVGWLLGLYFVVLIIHIPKVVYEVLLYAACFVLLTYSDGIGAWVGIDPIWFVFPACLGLLGALWVTYGLHIEGTDNNPFKYGYLYWGRARKSRLDFTVFSSIVCMFAWGAVAVLHQSELIAFIATMSLMSFLGFSVFVAPFCIGLGYNDENTIARTTFAASIILLVGVATRVSGLNLGRFAVFSYSFIWLGTFVYFCSMLLVANKWYSKDNYIQLTILTLVSGVAALYVGSVYNIPVLQSMGGTFFLIWLTEKYFEIPWGSKGAAWAMLLGAIMLYYFAAFAQKHPDYFLFQGVPAAKAGVTNDVQ